MSQQDQNILAAQRGYQAFTAGDLDTVMTLTDDNCEWIMPGRSAISGTHRGRKDIRNLMGRFAEKQLRMTPTRLIADGDTVVAMLSGTLGGEDNPAVQVTTWRNGLVVKAETYGDTGLEERVFGLSRQANARSNS